MLDIEIIGVVKDGKYNNLRNEKVRVVYMPFHQEEHPGQISYAIRTGANPESLMPQIRRTVAQIDATLALWDFQTMDHQLETSLFAERMVAILCACFGVLRRCSPLSDSTA